MKQERKRDRIAAGRAVSVELEANLLITVAMAAAGCSELDEEFLFHPSLARKAFDDRLPLMSELLTAREFQSLAAVYAGATALFSLLETERGRAASLTAESNQQFRKLAEQFAKVASQLAARAWPEEEQQFLTFTREEILKKLVKKNSK
jgi:hypothetical protein